MKFQQCPYCKEIFSQNEIQNHMEEEFCLGNFISKGKFKRKPLRIEINTIICPFCSFLLSNIEEYGIHVKEEIKTIDIRVDEENMAKGNSLFWDIIKIFENKPIGYYVNIHENPILTNANISDESIFLLNIEYIPKYQKGLKLLGSFIRVISIDNDILNDFSKIRSINNNIVQSLRNRKIKYLDTGDYYRSKDESFLTKRYGWILHF